LLEQAGVSVVVECQPTLVSLIARVPGVRETMTRGSGMRRCDVQVPLASLPNLLGVTDISLIPAERSYLQADPRLVTQWRERLASDDAMRVGIVWKGSSKHPQDCHRSIPVEQFASLATIPGVKLVSLQPGQQATLKQGEYSVSVGEGSFNVRHKDGETVDIRNLGTATVEILDSHPQLGVRALMLLADKGLPHSSNAGYELYDKMGSLGLTSFMQDVTRVRALEGELARTIQSMSGIKAARVHIVLPDEGSFRRVKQPPSASVVIRAATFDDNHVAQAIRHLVAAAVPGMTVDEVTVLSTDGALLASGDDTATGAPGKVLDLEKMVDRNIQDSIRKTLTPTLGPDTPKMVVRGAVTSCGPICSATCWPTRPSCTGSTSSRTPSRCRSILRSWLL